MDCLDAVNLICIKRFPESPKRCDSRQQSTELFGAEQNGNRRLDGRV
jgi:hypothetical protein